MIDESIAGAHVHHVDEAKVPEGAELVCIASSGNQGVDLQTKIDKRTLPYNNHNHKLLPGK